MEKVFMPNFDVDGNVTHFQEFHNHIVTDCNINELLRCLPISMRAVLKIAWKASLVSVNGLEK